MKNNDLSVVWLLLKRTDKSGGVVAIYEFRTREAARRSARARNNASRTNSYFVRKYVSCEL